MRERRIYIRIYAVRFCKGCLCNTLQIYLTQKLFNDIFLFLNSDIMPL